MDRRPTQNWRPYVTDVYLINPQVVVPPKSLLVCVPNFVLMLCASFRPSSHAPSTQLAVHTMDTEEAPK